METITFFNTGKGRWVWQMAIMAPIPHGSLNSHCMEFLSLKSRFSCQLILDSTMWLALANGMLAYMMQPMHFGDWARWLSRARATAMKTASHRSCCHSAWAAEWTCTWWRYPPPGEKPRPAGSRAWSNVTGPRLTPAHHIPTPPCKAPPWPEDQQVIMMILWSQETTHYGLETKSSCHLTHPPPASY